MYSVSECEVNEYGVSVSKSIAINCPLSSSKSLIDFIAANIPSKFKICFQPRSDHKSYKCNIFYAWIVTYGTTSIAEKTPPNLIWATLTVCDSSRPPLDSSVQCRNDTFTYYTKHSDNCKSIFAHTTHRKEKKNHLSQHLYFANHFLFACNERASAHFPPNSNRCDISVISITLALQIHVPQNHLFVFVSRERCFSLFPCFFVFVFIGIVCSRKNASQS